jgi:triosephosphate isomerase
MAGNWKMNLTASEAGRLALELKRLLADATGPEIVVAPTFVCLPEVMRVIQGSTLHLAGQNLHWKASGAFTGEISGPMLKSVGCEYVIIGHSERRQFFGETDETVNLRIKAALEHDLIPIFCIGETLAERESQRTWEVLTRQVVGGLSGLSDAQVTRIIIAYEPVWAIGTGKTASTAQAQEAHAFLRTLLRESYPRYVADGCRILYGGSVKADNVDALMAQPDVDGVLVGGASLDAASFARIVQFQPC